MTDTVSVRVADGVVLAASVWSGPETPFLLVHGLASNRLLWHPVAERLNSAGHHVATLDLRGHGDSQKPDSGYDFATMTADVVAAAHELGLERPVLVGQSYGGNLAVEAAVRFPEAFRGIAAVDGGVLDMHERWPEWEQCREAMRPPKLEMSHEQLRSIFTEEMSDWAPGAVEAAMACYEREPRGGVHARLTLDRHLAILRSMWEQRPKELFAQLDVPMLLLPCDTGEHSWTTHKQEAVTAAERNAKRVRARWFTANHDVHLQYPDDVARALSAAHRDGFFG